MTTTPLLREVLEEAGRGEHADAVEALVQPAVRIVATALAPRPVGFQRADGPDQGPENIVLMENALEALAIGASRFGGVPDMPPDATWPEYDGVPMEFIAQLRLAEVAPLDPGSRLRADPPRVEWQSEYIDTPQIAPMIQGMASLRFDPMTSLPSGVSPYIGPPLDAFWRDFECEHFDRLYPQREPYTDNQLLGYVGAPDFVDAHANGTEDQLLLQVDSCDAAEFQWGDCDKLYFLMTKAELAARDFSNVRIYSILG